MGENDPQQGGDGEGSQLPTAKDEGGSGHLVISFPQHLFTSLHNEFIGSFLSVASLNAISRFTPRSNRTFTTNRSFTFAAAMRMIARVHDNTAVARTDALPTGTAGFTDMQASS